MYLEYLSRKRLAHFLVFFPGKGHSCLVKRYSSRLFSPPEILFPVVWGVLYALMGISAARIYLSPPGRNRSKALNLYVIQLVVNFFWSLIFFNAQAYGFAFLWLLLLWGLVLQMILTFHKVDPAAAYLQIPYLLWLTFAAYLSIGVW